MCIRDRLKSVKKNSDNKYLMKKLGTFNFPASLSDPLYRLYVQICIFKNILQIYTNTDYGVSRVPYRPRVICVIFAREITVLQY